MTTKTTKIDGLLFSFDREKEFVKIHDEIFHGKVYQFTPRTSTPLILDCGANIGVSVLYFKKVYPQARVIAFEPNPQAFKLLEVNVRQNHLRDVELVNAAVSNISGEVDFYVAETSVRSAVSLSSGEGKTPWHRINNYEAIKVPAVKLSTYINQRVDLLKLDVEGMEEKVLEEIEEKLALVEDIKMEFHGSSDNEFNRIERIIPILERNGLKFMIKREDSKILNIVRVNHHEFVNMDQIKRSDPYYLMVYSNRRGGALWWQALVLSQRDRMLKVPRRLLAMRPLRMQAVR